MAADPRDRAPPSVRKFVLLSSIGVTRPEELGFLNTLAGDPLGWKVRPLPPAIRWTSQYHPFVGDPLSSFPSSFHLNQWTIQYHSSFLGRDGLLRLAKPLAAPHPAPPFSVRGLCVSS